VTFCIYTQNTVDCVTRKKRHCLFQWRTIVFDLHEWLNYSQFLLSFFGEYVKYICWLQWFLKFCVLSLMKILWFIHEYMCAMAAQWNILQKPFFIQRKRNLLKFHKYWYDQLHEVFSNKSKVLKFIFYWVYNVLSNIIEWKGVFV
jgi:hypothetical protein